MDRRTDRSRATDLAVSDAVGAGGAGVPPFSGLDIVRAFAGAYLPLCRDLHRSGVIDANALARRIRSRVGQERDAPWAALAISLAHVLQDDASRPNGSQG